MLLPCGPARVARAAVHPTQGSPGAGAARRPPVLARRRRLRRRGPVYAAPRQNATRARRPQGRCPSHAPAVSSHAGRGATSCSGRPMWRPGRSTWRPGPGLWRRPTAPPRAPAPPSCRGPGPAPDAADQPPCRGRPAWRPSPPHVAVRVAQSGPARAYGAGDAGRRSAGRARAPPGAAPSWPQYPRGRDDIDVDPRDQPTTYDRYSEGEGPLINHRA
jgi:hypothetical protein